MTAADAVSVITCTKRPDRLHHLLQNYGRQQYRYKELIVILNHPDLNPATYAAAAAGYPGVRVYAMPRESLGQCLNAGVKLSRHPYIAKFDDDDYYAAPYLSDSMQALRGSDADVVGKRAHFMYLESRKLLLLRYPDRENRFVPQVQGATLLARRHVFERAAFPDRTGGECVKFCNDCRRAGFRIYAADRYHFAAIRSGRAGDHTWTASDRELLARTAKAWRTDRYESFVHRR